MPGQQLQTIALVLGRQTSGADDFEQLSLFSEEHGVLPCLARLRTAGGKRGAAQSTGNLDLFDEAEVWLESSNQGRTWFLKEFRHTLRHAYLGRSYASLQVASALALLVVRNPLSEDSRAPVAELLRQSLGALAAGARPDVVWCKALFRLLRDEGHPVKQLWWTHLPDADRAAATEILNQPAAAAQLPPEAVARLVRRLEDWTRAETEFRLG